MERTPRRDSLNPDDDGERDSVDLLGYLLGAVDPEEAAEIAARLECDPVLREQADRIYASLPRSDEYWSNEPPPPGLADRTLAGLESLLDSGKVPPVGASHGDTPLTPTFPLETTPDSVPVTDGSSDTASLFPMSRLAPLAASDRLPAESRNWRALEWFVGLASVAIMACLLLQALLNSRHQARLLLCQDNLRSLGRALQDYAMMHRGLLPQGDSGTPLEVAGAYAPLLAQERLISDEQVLCPSSDAALTRVSFRIPKPYELERMSPTALAYAQSNMGGDFGFTLGYEVDGELQDLSTDGSPFRVIMADLPTAKGARHAGQVINVLFDDGHLSPFHRPATPLIDDSVFVNRAGRVAPGLDPDDSVIAPSGVSRVRALEFN